MIALAAALAAAQTPPCDDPPPEKPEPVKCEAETVKDGYRQIDLGALLGAPAIPKVDPGCRRTLLTVERGNPMGVSDSLANVDEALEACAVAARKRAPGLEGAAAFTLTVEAQGRVADVTRGSATLTDTTLLDCFERALGKARFTPGSRVVRVDVGCRRPES